MGQSFACRLGDARSQLRRSGAADLDLHAPGSRTAKGAERKHHRSARQPGRDLARAHPDALRRGVGGAPAKPAAASLHGLLVGLLVAVIFGGLYFWPFNLWGLLLFALMIAAGLLGALVGFLVPSSPK